MKNILLNATSVPKTVTVEAWCKQMIEPCQKSIGFVLLQDEYIYNQAIASGYASAIKQTVAAMPNNRV